MPESSPPHTLENKRENNHSNQLRQPFQGIHPRKALAGFGDFKALFPFPGHYTGIDNLAFPLFQSIIDMSIINLFQSSFSAA
jgi:hypothetical protein